MYYLGVDLGGTNIKAGLVNEKGEILIKDSIPTNAARPADEIIKDMSELCKNLCKQFGIDISELECVGIATPGSVDNDSGMIFRAYNLPFENYPMAQRFAEYSGVKNVYVENDANAAAKAEVLHGAAKGSRNCIMITLGTGVGGGVIIDGKAYSGFNHSGGELGHMVIEVGGTACTCGRLGCWEAYSSATGLVNMTREKMLENENSLMWKLAGSLDNVSGKTAFDAMKKGDAAGREVVDKYIKYLAAGITNMINIFQPEFVVIGGGVCKEGEYLTKPLQEYVDREDYSRDNDTDRRTKIEIAKLGNDAGIIGAAMLGN